jgi:hypothetical protein
MRIRPLAFLLCLVGLWFLVPGRAAAHSTNFAVYSKFEATTHGRAVAIVYALDKQSTLGLMKRDLSVDELPLEALPTHLDYFSIYLFGRLFVTNDGQRCVHPPELGRFFWDESTGRILAVTHFVCPSELGELTIRSTLTHDMPSAHQTVGDLLHQGTLVRSYFFDDQVEALLRLDEPNFGVPPRQSESRGSPRAGRMAQARTPEPDQKRRYEELAFAELGETAGSAPSAGIEATPGGFFRLLAHFIWQGVWHIVIGYDHVLVIVTLLVGLRSWRRLLWIVTSFTLAHSLTLLVATLGLVRIPGAIIEPLIALTVLAVAVDAWVRPHAEAQVLMTFAFGLIHGFGLSGVLVELGVVGEELLPSLLGFNLGVEVGQLCIVLPLFPAVLWLRHHKELWYRRVRVALCGGVSILACVWFVTRVHEALTG